MQMNAEPQEFIENLLNSTADILPTTLQVKWVQRASLCCKELDKYCWTKWWCRALCYNIIKMNLWNYIRKYINSAHTHYYQLKWIRWRLGWGWINQRGSWKWIWLGSRVEEEISWILHDSFQDKTHFNDSKWRGFLPEPSFLASNVSEAGRHFRQTVGFFWCVVVAITVFNEPPHLY